VQKEENNTAPILFGYLRPYRVLYIVLVYRISDIYNTKDKILVFKMFSYTTF